MALDAEQAIEKRTSRLEGPAFLNNSISKYLKSRSLKHGQCLAFRLHVYRGARGGGEEGRRKSLATSSTRPFVRLLWRTQVDNVQIDESAFRKANQF